MGELLRWLICHFSSFNVVRNSSVITSNAIRLYVAPLTSMANYVHISHMVLVV